jgi:G3E family GTPase
MAVYKEEKTNTWRAVYRYTDWNGDRMQKIVFIGQHLDKEQLIKDLDACLE